MKKEFIEINGIQCEVKNPGKRNITRFYQEVLRPEIDKYIGNNTMSERKKAYADALEINLIIAPFVLGWLKRPEDEDEYRVITGRMSIDDLNKKRKAENKNISSKKPSDNTKKGVETKKAIKKTAPKKIKKV